MNPSFQNSKRFYPHPGSTSIENRSFNQPSQYSSNKKPQASIIDKYEQRHYAHQQNLRNLINDSSSKNPLKSSYVPMNQSNCLSKHEEYNPRSFQETPFSPSVFPVKRRNLSEIPDQMNRMKFSGYNPERFSTAQKQNIDFIKGANVSQFEMSDFIGNKKEYDSIIVPTYSQARCMTFEERRRNFCLNEQRRENDKLNNQAYIKKLHDSFYHSKSKNKTRKHAQSSYIRLFQ